MDLGRLRELSQRRECKTCGAVFEGTEFDPVLAKFTDHLTIHQPTGAQWAAAYYKIQEAMSRKGNT